ncbi:MAG: PD40 domain-containing protein, partial [Verrucomicrobia bacterium]|nr:PD40 domain-containing protein [Cytophagales bacterium]
LAITACNSPAAIYKKGKKKFDEFEYQTAIDFMEKAKSGGHAPATTNFYIAESYRLTNRLTKAEPYYKAAIDARSNQESTRFQYGYALKAAGKYKEAIEQFELYQKSGSSQKNKARARKELENLTAIEELATAKTPYEVENLSALNTQATEFSPAFFQDELVITASLKDRTYKANGMGMLGLYSVKTTNDSIFDSKVKLFSEDIFEETVNEGTPAFSPDGKRVVFSRSNGKRQEPGVETDLYTSVFKDNKWSEPTRLDISATGKGNRGGWDGCPAFSTDGKTLYFASNREGTFGGLDLYRATLDGSGRFRGVSNMGSAINTAGNEMFPYVAADAKLYFASDGHPGLGGLDIFVASRQGGETTLRNMGVPVNSVGDDFGLVWKTPMLGYLSSNREGGKGDDDIYIVRNKNVNFKVVNYYLAGTVFFRDKENNNKETLLAESKVQVFEGEKLIKEFTTDAEGRFGKIKVSEGKIYNIKAEKQPDFLAKRETFSMFDKIIPQEALIKAITDTTYEVIVVLDPPVKVGDKFVVKNILYDFDKWDIRPDAALELDKLVLYLQDNPKISVELSSHTDDRGSVKFNEVLSQKRAESATAYIVSKGIAQERITAKGYGKTDLLFPDAQTEDEHQENRRTEIEITNIDK